MGAVCLRVINTCDKYKSHANTRKQTLCEQNQIPIRNKLQGILQCNRYIHLVKCGAEFVEYMRVPNSTARIETKPTVRT